MFCLFSLHLTLYSQAHNRMQGVLRAVRHARAGPVILEDSMLLDTNSVTGAVNDAPPSRDVSRASELSLSMRSNLVRALLRGCMCPMLQRWSRCLG